MKFLGWQVQKRDKTRYKSVSALFQSKSGAESFREMYLKDNPGSELLIVPKTRGQTAKN